MTKSRLPLLCFFACAALHILAEILQWQNIVLATKPLLIPLLAWWFYRQIKGRSNNFTRWIGLGFFFSFLGDTFLLFPENDMGGELFFLLGLGSFLLTHLFYFYAFVKYKPSTLGYLQRNKWLVLPFLFFLFANTAFLWNGVPMDMKIPVLVYSSAIVLMVLGCLNLKTKLAKSTFTLLFSGVCLFLISDTFIGVNKFHTPLPAARLLIMIPYLAGQFLIATGAIQIVSSRK